MLRIFIAGTDTDVGKTYVSIEILRFFSKKGLQTICMKPIAYGCFEYKGMVISKGAELLQSEASVQLPYDQVNPFRFKDIAAGQSNYITSQLMYKRYQEVSDKKAHVLVVEGTGGWCCPINNKETMADFVQKTDLGVVLVVMIKLGCLNHAILTAQNMLARNIKIIGWVANCYNPDTTIMSKNIETLKAHLTISFLGRINHNEKIKDGSELTEALIRFAEGSLAT